jgi:hypothetical protein
MIRQPSAPAAPGVQREDNLGGDSDNPATGLSERVQDLQLEPVVAIVVAPELGGLALVGVDHLQLAKYLACVAADAGEIAHRLMRIDPDAERKIWKMRHAMEAPPNGDCVIISCLAHCGDIAACGAIFLWKTISCQDKTGSGRTQAKCSTYCALRH